MIEGEKGETKPRDAAAEARLCVLCVALPSRGHLVTYSAAKSVRGLTFEAEISHLASRNADASGVASDPRDRVSRSDKECRCKSPVLGPQIEIVRDGGDSESGGDFVRLAPRQISRPGELKFRS